ncbi:MerR family transcriptional regulator [Roseimaritima ulvae]|uniref:DNA ligase n=1 Tax=Roseimaritima ulvae TaxID=980254 RepID=A0A5B9QIR8_9BACT|nr:MerR family transcriptional regulator [Roseimaritima ulvae]QEG39007.1 DNA ligase [Roseimaritima ulvae]
MTEPLGVADDLDQEAHDDQDEAAEEQDQAASLEESPQTFQWIAGKRIAFVGKLGGVSRREAMQIVRSHGAVAVESADLNSDVVVIGAEESPLAEAELLGVEIRSAAGRGELEVIHETEFWQRLGLVDSEQAVKRLYTPAMLADLLDVSVRVIRRWHRRGLIVPVRTVHKLPYFDFQEIATARKLAELVAAGATPQEIERKLLELTQVITDVQRPLTQLSILVEGKQLLLRQGEGLLEPGGQLRIDFDALEEPVDDDRESSPAILSLSAPQSSPASSPHRHGEELGEVEFPPGEGQDDDLLLQQAYESEDAGDLELAVDLYHSILARDGARADICFQLGELLYRMGETTAARERYYAAIELDEAFVEARASLGSVLAETGQLELAVAAFRGALALHDEYPDVHYNLARTLDDLQREDEADPHWRRFLQLSPNSPWADEAQRRLAAK